MTIKSKILTTYYIINHNVGILKGKSNKKKDVKYFHKVMKLWFKKINIIKNKKVLNKSKEKTKRKPKIKPEEKENQDNKLDVQLSKEEARKEARRKASKKYNERTAKCGVNGCDVYKSYGPPGGIKTTCSDHAATHWINLKNKQCEFKEIKDNEEIRCTKLARYGNKGEKKKYCSDHKQEGHINLLSKKCNHPGCDTVATYGIKGKGASKCSTHAPTDGTYRDIIHRHCECGKRAGYGLKGGLPLSCYDHQKDGYIDVTSPKCNNVNCEELAFYGLKTGKPLSCQKHKDDNYINLKSKQCLIAGCDITSTYGPKNGSSIMCANHGQAHGYKPNKRNICQYNKCNSRASFGKKGEKPTHCSKHKGDGINLLAKKCCIDKCEERANYNLPGYVKKYCKEHKTDNMINNPTKKHKKETNNCTYCHIELDDTLEYCKGCKTYKSLGQTVKSYNKEIEIRLLLDKNEIKYEHDIIVKDGCSRKRPDFLIYANNGKAIILEIDEHQHKKETYSPECEIRRMQTIYFDLGVKDLLFIRYNPDNYKTTDAVYNNYDRQKYLIRYLNSHIVNASFENLNVVYLFYNDFKPDQPIRQIDPYKAEEVKNDPSQRNKKSRAKVTKESENKTKD